MLWHNLFFDVYQRINCDIKNNQVMKKALLTIAGSLMIGLSVVHAQTDTTRNRQQPNPQTTQPPVQPPQPTTPARQGDQYRTQDRIVIPQNQVPSTLRETLQGNQYKGWENSTLYQDRTTGEYSLDLNNGSATPRTYRFDKNGRVIDNMNRPQQGGVKDQ
jgi:hypothetical protein